MRIQKVSFSNLNSLYGTWEIDFTHEAYLSDGLFAITGPTGAGKSTILDAICLALYGRTPRLESIGAQTNEIMSRQRAACFSEVTFETREGLFRCSWAQHRAHNRVDGNLIQAKHELVDAKTGEVLESKKREVAQAVERCTGMTFERFTRSMLLAQGQFAAFLNADADQRAPILEQITGTEIYSQISRMVHERRREQEQLLERMRDELHHVTPLSKDEVELLQAREALLVRWERGAARKQEAAQHARDILMQIEDLYATRAELMLEQKALAELVPEMQSLRLEYEQSMAALEIEPQYQGVQRLRAQCSADEKKLSQGETKAFDLNQRDKEVQVEAEQCKRAYELAGRQWEHAESILEAARGTEGKLATELRIADALREQLLGGLKNRRASLVKLESLREQFITDQKAIAKQEAWLHEHRMDGQLSQVLQRLTSEISALKQAGEKGIQWRARVEELGREITQRSTSLDTIRTELNQVDKEIAKNDRKLSDERAAVKALLAGRTKKEYEQESEHLQEKKLLLVKIAKLEDLRGELQQGSPCPLCGALEHPYADSGTPQYSNVDKRIETVRTVLRKLADSEARIQAVSDEQSLLLQRKSAIGASIESCENQKQEAATEQDRARSQVALQEDTYHTHGSIINEALKPWGVTFPSVDQFDHAQIEQSVQELEARCDMWVEADQARKTAEAALALLNKQITDNFQRLQDDMSNVKSLREKMGASRARSATLRSTLIDLIGGTSVSEWETLRRAEFEQAEKAHREAQQNRSDVQHERALLSQGMQVIEERLERQQDQLRQEEQAFLLACTAHGFETEKMYLKSKRDASERLDMHQRLNTYDRRSLSCDQRLEEVTGSLARIEQLPVDRRWSKDILEQTLEWASREQARVNRSLGALQERLEADVQKHAQFTDSKRTVDAQRETLMGYDRLNSLIGSHDGKKFRNFAQSLTFEMLIGHANEHVRILSDRYMLTPDPDRPLDIAVIDLYQAGQVRSAKNLSGGESFLVSLALSLALSTIASKRVQVDSLFLDEGFGTLDEEALETALTALSTLRSQGKLVGIISHVGALQERIPVRISVIPIAGGVSRLEGPGCRAI